jgi:hypothetical protein
MVVTDPRCARSPGQLHPDLDRICCPSIQLPCFPAPDHTQRMAHESLHHARSAASWEAQSARRTASLKQSRTDEVGRHRGRLLRLDGRGTRSCHGQGGSATIRLAPRETRVAAGGDGRAVAEQRERGGEGSVGLGPWAKSQSTCLDGLAWRKKAAEIARCRMECGNPRPHGVPQGLCNYLDTVACPSGRQWMAAPTCGGRRSTARYARGSRSPRLLLRQFISFAQDIGRR